MKRSTAIYFVLPMGLLLLGSVMALVLPSSEVTPRPSPLIGGRLSEVPEIPESTTVEVLQEPADEVAESDEIDAEGLTADAILWKGHAFRYGMNSPRDYKKAFAWYTLAAERGNAEAAYQLGVMHRWGVGTRNSLAEAFPFFKQAAEGGHTESMLYVGHYYERGWAGMEQDFEAAEKWMLASLAAGNENAEINLRVLRQSIEANNILEGNPYEKILTENGITANSAGAAAYIDALDAALAREMAEGDTIDVELTANLLRASIKTLGYVGDENALMALLQAVPLAEGHDDLPAVLLDTLKTVTTSSDIAYLQQAVHDPDLGIRTAAVKLLLSLQEQPATDAAKEGLYDEEELVRFATAREMADMGEPMAIPALMNLMLSEDPDIRLSGYLVLRDLTGEDLPFTPEASEAERLDDVVVWMNTLLYGVDEVRMNFPLEGFSTGNYLDGNTLSALGYANKVVETDIDGNPIWELEIEGPRNAVKLSDGNYLVSARGDEKVVEVNTDGEVVWEYAGDIMRARALESGNFLMADYGERKAIEVDPIDNSVVWEYLAPANVYDVRQLENGNVLLATHTMIREVSRDKKTVWEHDAYARTAQRLDNGNTLYADWWSGAVEVDPDGNKVWEFDEKKPTDAYRLPNGNTLITTIHRAIEVTPKGEIIEESKAGAFGSVIR